jgi:tRNA modification GTPase
MQFGNWSMRLIDTAGIENSAANSLEALCMDRSLECAAAADLLIWVIDSSVNNTSTMCLPDKLTDRKGIIVLNKRDLPVAVNGMHNMFSKIDWPIIEISTKIDNDIVRLQSFLDHYLVEADLLPNEEQILINFRHFEALREAIDALFLAETIADGCEELLAAELNRALIAVNRIVGKEEISDVILDSVFGQFCIGK